MLASALLAAALAIAGWGWMTRRSLPARIAALAGRASRPRTICAWALGTAATYGLTSILALALLGRVGAVSTMPVELRVFAWRVGLPGAADAAALTWLAAWLAVGIGSGAAIVAVRRRLGKRPLALPYRSPAAARAADERLPAALLALAAGVGEELFFRLLIPLLCALAFGSAAIGFALSLALFTALHRHQGLLGMAAAGLAGAWLTYLYLLTGAVWVVAALHVAVDLRALLLPLAVSSSAATRS